MAMSVIFRKTWALVMYTSLWWVERHVDSGGGGGRTHTDISRLVIGCKKDFFTSGLKIFKIIFVSGILDNSLLVVTLRSVIAHAVCGGSFPGTMWPIYHKCRQSQCTKRHLLEFSPSERWFPCLLPPLCNPTDITQLQAKEKLLADLSLLYHHLMYCRTSSWHPLFGKAKFSLWRPLFQEHWCLSLV